MINARQRLVSERAVINPFPLTKVRRLLAALDGEGGS
jgi:hypothetical protein